MPEALRCGAKGLETMADLRRVLRGRVIRLEIHLNGTSLRMSKQSGGPNVVKMERAETEQMCCTWKSSSPGEVEGRWLVIGVRALWVYR